MIQEKLKKLEKRKITDSHKLDVDPKQVFVISCKNREKNHRIGQKYTPGVIEQEKIGYNFYERDRNLASYGWGHRKSQGDFFILNAYGGVCNEIFFVYLRLIIACCPWLSLLRGGLCRSTEYS